MGMAGLISMLVTTSCTSFPEPVDIENIHFPRLKPSPDYVVISNTINAEIRLIDNCIYAVKGKHKSILVWPAYARLEDRNGEIFITSTGLEPQFKEYTNLLQIEKKATLDAAPMGTYVFTLDGMLPTVQSACEDGTDAIHVRNWKTH